LVGSTVTGTYFDRFVLFIFENTNYAKAIKNSYLKTLGNQGVLFTNYFAVAHPSEPNYVAQIFGSTFNITDDGDYNITGTNLVDLLESRGITWKAYMQNYMNADNLDADIASNSVPQFVYYVPNQQNDAHDTSIDFAMSWFQPFFEARRTNPNFNTNTLFFIVFDESGSGPSNQIYASIVGTPVNPPSGHSDNTAYNHYSIPATIEANWGLGNMGRFDSNATAFT
ncbi:513_t:CDS:2, partial [Cetraspora pellucida]